MDFSAERGCESRMVEIFLRGRREVVGWYELVTATGGSDSVVLSVESLLVGVRVYQGFLAWRSEPSAGSGLYF